LAGRTLNRQAWREQVDRAEQLAQATPESTAAEAPRKRNSRAKRPGAPRVTKPRKAKIPPRLCARWGVFDGGMKQVAIFDYNQRAAAEDKLADLLCRRKGLYFLQVVKEPMPEPAPVTLPAEM
jgi:hypothetical protein